MPTKSKPSTRMSHVRYKSNLYHGNGSPVSWWTGSDVITYSDGRKDRSGHWPWKSCVHTTNNYFQPIVGETLQSFKNKWNDEWYLDSYNIMINWPLPTFSASAWDESVLGNLLDQIDLNCRDSVMLYANVVQAVPLLGGVMKFNSIMRKIARHISKGMRRKPFTTVLKSVISADFIDRFVISPTIDDARKFQDACNYVLRVMNTAHKRASGIFALDSTVKTVHSEEEKTVVVGTAYGPDWRVRLKNRSYTESKAFMLCKAKYDLGGVSPIKMWAARTGFTRPLESAWDLVPFSFVADYFARGQDFISALSNEMTRQEGLCGQITEILDMWASVNNVSESVVIGSERTGKLIPESNSNYSLIDSYDIRPMWSGKKTQEYRRFRIDKPWQRLARLESQPADWCKITFNPTAVQKRTIAELVIQAKL